MDDNTKIEDNERWGESIQDMIKHSLDQDFNKANAAFGEVMTIKLDDLLTQEKANIAGTIYNDDDDELEDEDDELEDDDEDIDEDEIDDEDYDEDLDDDDEEDQKVK